MPLFGVELFGVEIKTSALNQTFDVESELLVSSFGIGNGLAS